MPFWFSVRKFISFVGFEQLCFFMDLTTTIGQVLNLIGAVVLFLFGMKIMSEALQKVAGSKLRHFLCTLTYNKGRAILTGLLITGIIQSSSAFTVMTVGLVNAGLVSLSQSVGLIMGANMGTTVTAWLVFFLGLAYTCSRYYCHYWRSRFPFFFQENRSYVTQAKLFLVLSFFFSVFIF